MTSKHINQYANASLIDDATTERTSFSGLHTNDRS